MTDIAAFAKFAYKAFNAPKEPIGNVQQRGPASYARLRGAQPVRQSPAIRALDSGDSAAWRRVVDPQVSIPLGMAPGGQVTIDPIERVSVPFVGAPAVRPETTRGRGSAFGRRKVSTPPSTEAENAMDLGNVLGTVADLGSSYINARWGGSPVAAQPAAVNPGFNHTFVDSAIIPNFLEDPLRSYLDAPPTAGPVSPDQSTKGWVWNPNADCGRGKWQKRSRRRRKRLASQSDLKDLAALKGILGNGKAFEVWIATH